MAVDVKMILNAQDNASSVLKGLENSFKGLSSTVESAMAPMLSSLSSFQGILGTVAGGAGIASLVSAYSSWSGEVIGLGRNLGMTTEQASIFNTALRLSGVDSDTAVSAGMRLARTIDTNEEKFAKLGVSVRDSSGNLRATPAIMADVMAALKSISSGTERNVLANEIFGRSWQDVQSLMKLTPEIMDKAGESASALGLVIDKDGAEAAKRYKLAMNELGLAGDSIKIKLGNELMPVMVALAEGMTGVAGHMGTVKVAMLEMSAVGVLTNLDKLKKTLEGVRVAAMGIGTGGMLGLGIGLAGTALMFGAEWADQQNTKDTAARDKASDDEYKRLKAINDQRRAATRPDLSLSVGMTDAERSKMLAEQQAFDNATMKLEEQKDANILSRYTSMAAAYLSAEKTRYDMGAASADQYYTYKLQLLTWETLAQEKNLDSRLIDLRRQLSAEDDRTKQLGIQTEIEKVKGDKEKILMEQSKKRIDIVRELTDAEKKEMETKTKQLEQDEKERQQLDEKVNQLWPKYAEQLARELGMDAESVKLSKQLADGIKTQTDLNNDLAKARKLADDPAIIRLQKMIELQEQNNKKTKDAIDLNLRKNILSGTTVGLIWDPKANDGVGAYIPIDKDTWKNQNKYQTDASLMGKPADSPTPAFGSVSSSGVISGFSSNAFTSDSYWNKPRVDYINVVASNEPPTAAVVDPPAAAVGTPYVRKSGLAYIHEGEAVVTAAQNKAGSGITVNGGLTFVLPAGSARDQAKALYTELQQLSAGRFR